MSWMAQWFTMNGGEKDFTKRVIIYAATQTEATKQALAMPQPAGTLEVLPLDHNPGIDWDSAREV